MAGLSWSYITACRTNFSGDEDEPIVQRKIASVSLLDGVTVPEKIAVILRTHIMQINQSHAKDIPYAESNTVPF